MHAVELFEPTNGSDEVNMSKLIHGQRFAVARPHENLCFDYKSQSSPRVCTTVVIDHKEYKTSIIEQQRSQENLSGPVMEHFTLDGIILI